MKAFNSLVSLKMEIPVVETTKEGLLAGGFTSISLSAARTVINLNCPNASRATCSDKPQDGMDYENVNCPKVTDASCGTTDSKGGRGILLPSLLM